MSVRAKKASKSQQPTPEPKSGSSDKLYMENTLLRVAGALFCHDQKRARARTAPIELNKGADKRITIRLDPEYGQPGPLAHKLFVALMRKHSGYGRPIQREISFRQRELARLIGRDEWGGSASRQLTRALIEIHYTFVKASFQSDRTNLWTEHSFNIFPEITISRRTEHSQVIEACVVALAEPILASLRDSHFTCLNYSLISQLGTIGQALYMRLFFHFANLYEQVGKAHLSVAKRYDDICNEWLGGLTVLRHRSRIENDQLGPHLRQLCEVGFLASYAIEPMSAAEGFKITFRPGRLFLADYDRYYRRRSQSELQFEYEEERRDLQEPLHAVRLFLEKRSGKVPSPFTSVSEKDVETARQIIASVGFADFDGFLTYSLAEAQKTNFPVKFLGGLKQYVDGYLNLRKNAAAARKAEEARRAKAKEEEDRDAYERHLRKAAERLLAELPAAERDALRTEAAKLAGAGPFSSRFTELRLITLVAQRYADRLPTYESWQRSQGRGR